VPPPPERVGVTVVPVMFEILRVVGAMRNTDFPAKKLIFKLPDPAVGTVDATV
jgi:hypothetical protein